MNKCPRCGNEKMKKGYILGLTAETGQFFCDVCVKLDQYRKPIIEKLKAEAERKTEEIMSEKVLKPKRKYTKKSDKWGINKNG